MTLEINKIRDKFPALNDEIIYFDNPAGTQVVRNAVDRMTTYMIETNANHEGVFASSRASDAVIDDARLAMSEFLNANSPNEIVYGPNMTSLTFHLSRSLAHLFNPGDTIVVTRLDHDANISPWVLIAEDGGLNIEWVDFNIEDGTLDMDSFSLALEKSPKLVAVGYASNALGTINPVKKIIEMAKSVGALTFIDAVQYAPHGLIDVQDLDCDFLVCSAYKFYGPHLGILFGKFDLLDELKAYKVRPSSNKPPEKWQTGTANFEGICSTHGALEHFAWVGDTFGQDYKDSFSDKLSERGMSYRQGMASIRAYEYELSRRMIDTLNSIPGIKLYGINDIRRIEERVPTFAINLAGMHPKKLAEELDKHNIYVWDGNYYALAVTEHLGVEDSGGMVRIGPAHYNTVDEIDRFGRVLEKIKNNHK
ncbi:MAG: cysteine desulfurase-like protein [Chloroflexi bacterium]|jgi:cysteine desulfurase family protein (TIGR01976 family)|nr:cysteine desulfurase-like protein [Chloroflexota bacterium]MBT3668996.1 cysteine desulfurase-like protein [Chloroflexota bacterium]MBT4003597.1 cysteine desulfurase-like protein [Chloroflexota bacterium]MBT4304967.1 cysteine desulfurase-like protein [Chloroflexota bacterium]MBT4533270.1 cysteine desulfurase-like protein [Chloroflexota bacterium]